jgi:hypothetical protein
MATVQQAADEARREAMKEVEKKDLPEITGGQTGTTSVVVTPVPATPTFPGGPTINDPDPFGDPKQRPVQS